MLCKVDWEKCQARYSADQPGSKTAIISQQRARQLKQNEAMIKAHVAALINQPVEPTSAGGDGLMRGGSEATQMRLVTLHEAETCARTGWGTAARV